MHSIGTSHIWPWSGLGMHKGWEKLVIIGTVGKCPYSSMGGVLNKRFHCWHVFSIQPFSDLILRTVPPPSLLERAVGFG